MQGTSYLIKSKETQQNSLWFQLLEGKPRFRHDLPVLTSQHQWQIVQSMQSNALRSCRLPLEKKTIKSQDNRLKLKNVCLHSTKTTFYKDSKCCPNFGKIYFRTVNVPLLSDLQLKLKKHPDMIVIAVKNQIAGKSTEAETNFWS